MKARHLAALTTACILLSSAIQAADAPQSTLIPGAGVSVVVPQLPAGSGHSPMNSADAVLPPGHVAAPGSAIAAKLFFDNCVAYAGRAAQLKLRLDSLYPVTSGPSERLFLDQKPGKVWISKLSEGNFGLVVLDDGTCMIKAETVPAGDTMAAVEKEAGARHMQAITVADDKSVAYEGMTGHRRSYDLIVAGVRQRIQVDGMDAHLSIFESEISMPPASVR